MVKCIVMGACGRMGSLIIETASAEGAVKVIAAVEAPGHPCVGEVRHNLTISGSLEKYLKEADVVIDFSEPAATIAAIPLIVKARVPAVIGTTGFGAQDTRRISDAAQSVPVVFSPNMSAGVNVLFQMSGIISAILKEYDVEILEIHHAQKKDAPSGTALEMAREVCQARGWDTEKAAVYGRAGSEGRRRERQVGIHAMRMGDVAGEHTVVFSSPGERIEVTHRAHSRICFARGALAAAQWIADKKPGLYTMQNVLGLKE